MEEGELVAVPGPSTELSRRVFGSMSRMDQQRWAEIYLVGLMSVPGRKSLRNIADYVGIGCGVQSLQQFVNQSPWAWEPVRRSVADLVEELVPTLAWSVRYTVIPKRGDHSVGVQRRFVPTEGRTVNCQIGAAVHLVSATASVPVNWRLVLSNRWTDHDDRRRRARIPDGVRPRTEHQLVLDMIEEMAGWGLPRRPVLVDLSHEVNPMPLLTALEDHGVSYVVEVSPSFGVLTGTHLYPVRRGDRRFGAGDRHHVSVRDSVRGHRLGPASRRWPPAGAAPDLLATALATLPRRGAARRAQPVRVVGRRSATPGGERFWITNLIREPVSAVADLIALPTGAAEAGPGGRDGFGVLDFEGRSFRGWHHHMTLVSAAHAADLAGMRPVSARPIAVPAQSRGLLDRGRGRDDLCTVPDRGGPYDWPP